MLVLPLSTRCNMATYDTASGMTPPVPLLTVRTAGYPRDISLARSDARYPLRLPLERIFRSASTVVLIAAVSQLMLCSAVKGGGDLKGTRRICIAPDEANAFTLQENGTILVWNDTVAKSSAALRPKYTPNSPINNKYASDPDYFPAKAICVDPQSRDSLLFSNLRGVFIWPWKTKKSPEMVVDFRQLEGRQLTTAASNLVVSDDGKWLAWTKSFGEVALFSRDRQRMTILVEADLTAPSYCENVKFVPKTSILIYVEAGAVKSIDCSTINLPSRIEVSPPGQDRVVDFNLSKDGRAIVYLTDNSRIGLIKKGQLQPTILFKGDSADCACILDNCEHLAIGYNNGEIQVVSVATGNEVSKHAGLTTGYTSIQYVSKNRLIVACGEDEAPLVLSWDGKTLKRRRLSE